MRKTLAFAILTILLSPAAFAEKQVKVGGNLAFSRAGDTSADIGGFYIGVEKTFGEKYGLAFRLRKEGKKFLGPDNGYYFYFAGTYNWRPKVIQRIHKDALFKFRFGAELGVPHIDHNEYVETPRIRRWSFVSQSRGLFVIYPMTGMSAEIPLRWKFFKKGDFIVEVGMQVNFTRFGVQEVILDPSTDLFIATRDDRFTRPVPIMYMGLGFRY
jgi:hypothetical protein